MMFWPGVHRRFRKNLSPYIDGELEANAVERLEAHLAACEDCRLELRQLRATAAALHDLPEVQVPRSFVLSPERAAVHRRPLTGAVPLALGLRLAAAGAAVAGSREQPGEKAAAREPGDGAESGDERLLGGVLRRLR